MFSICNRRLLKLPLNGRFFHYPQRFQPQNAIFMELFSSRAIINEEAHKQQAFTVAYLIHKCGLMSVDAMVASKKVVLEHPEKPDRVLSVLKNYGFTKSNILRMIKKRPTVLKADPEKTLLPKLEFFQSIGIPVATIVGALSLNPDLLRFSLKNNLIPSYNCLISLVHTDKEIVRMFKRSVKCFGRGSHKNIPSNVAILREHRVPESFISYLAAYHPTTLISGTDMFLKYVNRAIEMGLDTSKYAFAIAIFTFSALSQSTYEHKCEIYKRWGWLESDIRLAFSVTPTFMALSEKKIMSTMNFLVNEVGCKPTAIAKSPFILCYDLEKRIMPRCHVAKVLVLKGLIKETTHVSSLMVLSNPMFIRRYITRYQDDIPQIFYFYQGKVGIADLGLLPDEVSKVKLL